MTTASTRAGRIISAVLHPAVTVPIGCWLVGVTAAGPPWGLLFCLLAATPPVAAVFILRAVGVFPSLRVPSRRHRVLLLAGTILWESAVAAAYAVVDAPGHLAAIQAAMTGGLVVLAAITLRTRVSVHVGVLAIFAAALAALGAPGWVLPIGVLMVIVAGARVAIAAHTPWQVLLGATGPALPVYLVAGALTQ